MLGPGALLAHLEPLKVTGLHLHHLCVVQHVKGSEELLTECCTPRCPRPELSIHSLHPAVLPSRAWQIRIFDGKAIFSTTPNGQLPRAGLSIFANVPGDFSP